MYQIFRLKGANKPPYCRRTKSAPPSVLAKKVGYIGRGGQVSAQGALHMAAALAVCRTAMVGTVWIILTLSAQIGAETTPPW